jgi:putative NADPH-quinone reductase
MHAHIVLAHPEPQSFNANLARIAARSLAAQGWSVSLSDLYAMEFDPCERAEHYIPSCLHSSPMVSKRDCGTRIPPSWRHA